MGSIGIGLVNGYVLVELLCPCLCTRWNMSFPQSCGEAMPLESHRAVVMTSKSLAVIKVVMLGIQSVIELHVHRRSSSVELPVRNRQ